MAHFEINRQRISNQTKLVRKLKPLDVDVSGYVKDLQVMVDPANSVRIIEGMIRDDVTKKINIRRYTLTPNISKTIRVMAKVNNNEWDWFELDVKPSAWFDFLTPEKRKFVEDMATAGKEVARQYRYPLSAMIACACSESQYGTSGIYHQTNSPFNLQRPDTWKWPRCDTVPCNTKSKVGQEKAAPAPFCRANDLRDAARLFCEWIDHYPGDGETPRECSDPDQKQRAALLAYSNNPRAFAENLYLVGFADNKRERTIEFGKVWAEQELGRFDN